jgi:hypothetical protein
VDEAEGRREKEREREREVSRWSFETSASLT